MKVVLDTNVLVSGLLFGGVPGRILTAWSTGAIRLVISPPILEEYRRVGLALSKGREPLVGDARGAARDADGARPAGGCPTAR
ncbi:MAG: putative toxin-antitoxin system toxin component, PIN family [Gemmatimonas sp.]|uniref:PIN domain-containing protein n=1 Tax=Gemmatimonas sp. TaxID=1962908 RepID=UPI00391BDD13